MRLPRSRNPACRLGFQLERFLPEEGVRYTYGEHKSGRRRANVPAHGQPD